MTILKLLSVTVIAFTIIVGCSKKKNENVDAMKQVPPELQTTKMKQDTADIFDEFYDESEKKPTNEPSSEDANFIENGRYVVQVSCVLSRNLADDVASQLSKKGYPTYVAEVENPTTDLLGLYHRVRIGGFNTLTDAKKFGDNQLVSTGMDFWVDNRSNDNVGVGGYGLGETDATSDYSSDNSSSSDSWSTFDDEATPETSPATMPEPVTSPESEETEVVEPFNSQPLSVPSQSADTTVSTIDDWGNDDWDSDTATTSW